MKTSSLSTLLVFLVTAATSLRACTVPVFRYALDRWPADFYRIEAPAVFEEKWAVHKQLVDVANVTLNFSNVIDTVKVFFPAFDGKERMLPVDVGLEDFAALVNSPVRQEMTRRLVSGESGVFLIVGDPSSEEFGEVKRRLETLLIKLAKALELPEIDPNDPSNYMSAGPPLKIAFSALSVDRNNPAERFLVPQLEFGLAEGVNPPTFVVPVYGRGRALGVIPPDDSFEGVIERVALFLTGPCSCQVKALNPGWDLIISIDWDDAVNNPPERTSILVEDKKSLTNEAPPALHSERSTYDLNNEKPTGQAENLPLIITAVFASALVGFGWIFLRPKTKN